MKLYRQSSAYSNNFKFVHYRRYSDASQDDLWHHLSEQAKEDGSMPKDLSVKEVMDTWTLQSGFPVVTITRDYHRNSALVSQVLYSVIFMAAVYSPVSLSEMDIEEAKKIIDINLNGALNTIYAVLPILEKQGDGQLVLCGSVAGYRGLPNGQPYSATKAAIINIAESWKAEHPELDVKVINPGFVKTPLTDKNKFKMPMMIEPENGGRAPFFYSDKV